MSLSESNRDIYLCEADKESNTLHSKTQLCMKSGADEVEISVLVVDDDVSFVEATAVYLITHGYCPIMAYTGRQAIQEARHRPVDLAIIDLYLPDMGGLQVAGEVCREHPAAVIIAISSDDSQETVQKCVEAGVHAFLAKPLLPRELLLRIREALGRCGTPR